MPFVASCSDLYQYFALLSSGCVLDVFHFACSTWKTLLVSEWEQ